MSFASQGRGALDYVPCRYGKSKLLFRGPKRKLDSPFCAAIGGTETYGKFVAEPWPVLLERRLGMPVVNFGYVNAGVDVFVGDAELSDVIRPAAVSVIQLMGAHNMSNRFYAVHPRRNDRFLRASSLMRNLFRDVDFSEFNFTRHMLMSLRERAPDRFEVLVEELRTSWVARMKLLLSRLEGEAVLMWLGEYRAQPAADPLGPDPLFIDPDMVAQIRPFASELVRVDPSKTACEAGTAGMQFAPLEAPAAAGMPGPAVHQEMAEALEPVLRRFL
ncbi:DUF6473 family protein [Phaeovulum vinaykumarii]|uniref:DUF6473 domain-containing protein n=1 Tax=Phaeovulum vinaykumarii TaxID=407234 RepID=A0A1N7KVT0_9RHOB|nr:DUF6473 family protein [Phaeovulum vinaykumarii]SIS65719.1 hypothetical protein SAMN05421795_102226 [Phaeovulum vinaykumarii]SOC01199.1 hypothetical protein SAMN05878426_102547 [Phaeovulum vinaykumarii]